MIVAAGFSAYRDAVFDVLLYTYVMINNVCTAAVQVGTKTVLGDVSKWQLLFVSAVVNWVWALVMIRSDDVISIPWSLPLLVALVASCVGGVCINVSAAWVIEKDGPLVLAMGGASKNIVVGLLSVLGLAGARYVYDFWNVVGLCVAAGASLVYVRVKHRTPLETKKVKHAIDV